MYVVIHNATGKTAEVEISGQYNRRKIIEVASEKTGVEISCDEVGHIQILPQKGSIKLPQL